MLNDLTLQTANTIAQQYFNIDVRKGKTLVGDADKNYYLQDFEGNEYILKIASPNTNLENLQMENQMMNHLAQQNLDLILPTVIQNTADESITILKDNEGNNRYIRVLTWVAGRMWSSINPVSEGFLSSLGASCGQVTKALEDFDHAGAHRTDYRWDNSNLTWVKQHLAYVEDNEQRALVEYFIALFENEVEPVLSQLRKAVLQNDFNDNNIVVDTDLANPKVVGLIDFGDSNYSPIINELAIAVAYAMMHQAAPLAAARQVIAGFHAQYPIEEQELAVLFPLITNRLLISVVNSSYNKVIEPDNEYLLISARPAWTLLSKLRAIAPNLARYHFRMACGLEAVPSNAAVYGFLKKNQDAFAPIVDFDFQNKPFKTLNLSVGSLDLGNNADYDTPTAFTHKINQILSEANTTIGVGGYNEARPIYTTDRYLIEGNNGPQWRAVHIGLDIFAPAGTPIYAPLDGVVHSFQNNAFELDYGPTIILEHQVPTGEKFYTLYGHLNAECLEGLHKGMPITKGTEIAKMGDLPINGNWPPHLHFQIILDMLGKEGDFFGVAFPSERDLWTSLCPDPNLILGLNLKKEDTLDSIAIFEKRKTNLGRSLSLSYQEPLHMVRGYKQYLYSADGRRYLDTVNNVPHVGHQHPRVVRAAQRQTALLNTNTRYLHENIVRYAEELCATLPAGLNVCHFVNSGSEANELAIRMARAYSGQRDLLVSEVGYHGNTNACIDVSSYKFEGKGGKGAPDWVHVLPIADGYRGLHRSTEQNAGSKYANYAQQAIEKVQGQGRNIAGFLCEPILSCGGQVVPPDGYFKEVYQHVRAAGGVCISDEVQVGFGRVGRHFWGFELHDVVPDIVVMGKPIGNGHPLGAVVTTEAVAKAFANGMEYFNTFGGNPVSCAIGRAVLQVIQEENLQQNAFEVGEYLKAGLRQLQTQFPIIGDVRGEGFFLGFELVKDRNTLEPAPEQTAYLANRMRQNGVLNSTDGLHHNVIKIKPPMCFNKTNADFLLEKFELIFKEDFMKVKS